MQQLTLTKGNATTYIVGFMHYTSKTMGIEIKPRACVCIEIANKHIAQALAFSAYVDPVHGCTCFPKEDKHGYVIRMALAEDVTYKIEEI